MAQSSSRDPLVAVSGQRTVNRVAQVASESVDEGADAKEERTSLKIWTLEDIDHSVSRAKTLLRWKEPESILTSIRIGVNQEELDFDSHIMCRSSRYFSNFSLPTVAYADQFEKTTNRLLHLSRAEADMLDWIIGWCHEPSTDGALLYEENADLTFDQWCYIWSLTDALHVPPLHETILEAVRCKCDQEDGLPPYTAVNYLYDLRHTNDELWEEFVVQHGINPDSPVKKDGDGFVQAFVDEVLDMEDWD